MSLDTSFINKGYLPIQAEDILYWDIEIREDQIYSIPHKDSYINIKGRELVLLGILVDVVQSGESIRVIKEGAWRGLNERLLGTRIGITRECIHLLKGTVVRDEHYGRYTIYIMRVSDNHGYYIKDVIEDEITHWQIARNIGIHQCLAEAKEIIKPRRYAA